MGAWGRLVKRVLRLSPGWPWRRKTWAPLLKNMVTKEEFMILQEAIKKALKQNEENYQSLMRLEKIVMIMIKMELGGGKIKKEDFTHGD